MGHIRFAAIIAIAAPLALSTSPAALAQSPAVRDCIVAGTLNPFGFNSQGTIDLNSGETCNLFLNTSGTIESSKISQRPRNGTLTIVDSSNAQYKPRPGFRGTDQFAFTVSGRTMNTSGTSVLKITANVR